VIIAITELEQKLADFLGRKHCCLTGRGATATYLALRALPVSAGKVVLPAIVCPSPANAVLYAGLEPIFCDINIDDYNLDPASLERVLAMYEDVVAVMPVHLYGYPADMERIQAIARKHRLYVIEDAAQALGAEYCGKRVGSFGDFSILSFGHTKIVDVGWGGAVLCDDDSLAAAVRWALAELPECPLDIDRSLANYRTVYYSLEKLCEMDERLNDLYFRLPPEKVGEIAARLDKLPGFVEKRQRNACEYDRLLSHPLIRKPKYRHTPVPWRFTFLLSGDVQKAVTARLRAEDVAVSNWYPPLHRWYASGKSQPRTQFPNAEFLGKHVINFWVDPDLELGYIKHTCGTLLNILNALEFDQHAWAHAAQGGPYGNR
jgi:dTDP-4-amino-4,6-dideoxygalactose transaminase